LRRHVRAIQDGHAPHAIWEVGSLEPGLDLADTAPSGFVPAADEVSGLSVPWGRLAYPFVFRTTHAAPGPPPAAISLFTTAPVDRGIEVSVSVTPHEPGVIVAFVAPEGRAPARSNLPGILRRGRWTATYVAPPRAGVSWRASFAQTLPNPRADIGVAVIVPWSEHPPAWLPQERSVWTGTATWVLTVPTEPNAEAASRQVAALGRRSGPRGR
jgi:hypothetical protein